MKLFGAKEPTEMDRVMENIRQVEAEIQQKIFQLGQAYYTDHRANDYGDGKYVPLIDQINKLDLNRNGFYKNKLRLEGQMMCENCRALIPYGSTFCNVCGKRADVRQAGEPAGGNVSSAVVTGSSADSSLAADAGAVAEMGATAASFPGAGARTCMSCGAVLEPGSMFCTSCGQKVEA